MRMSPDQVRDYAKFAQLVRTAVPALAREKKIMDAMKRNSGASEAIITKGLVWGSGPIVEVQMLIEQERGGEVSTPAGGYNPLTNTIGVSIGDVGRYQTGQDLHMTARGHVHYVTVTLLHELVHWAREQSGTNESPGKEDGFEFEKEVYGRIVEP